MKRRMLLSRGALGLDVQGGSSGQKKTGLPNKNRLHVNSGSQTMIRTAARRRSLQDERSEDTRARLLGVVSLLRDRVRLKHTASPPSRRPLCDVCPSVVVVQTGRGAAGE